MRVIQPGKSAASRLIRMVSGAEAKSCRRWARRSPPPRSRAPARWIDQGVAVVRRANRPVHWSFQKIQRPALPAVRNTQPGCGTRSTTSSSRGSTPKTSSPRPKRRKSTLLRRVSPRPDRPAAHARRKSPTSCTTPAPTPTSAWSTALLDSPHYGEKWARYWLDLARYADSDGYEKDRSRPWAWRYRHWVIDALNRDMPFDQFTDRAARRRPAAESQPSTPWSPPASIATP